MTRATEDEALGPPAGNGDDPEPPQAVGTAMGAATVVALAVVLVPVLLPAWVGWRIWIEARYLFGGRAYRRREIRRLAFFPRRYGGWWIEVDGRRVAMIDRPVFSDMYWVGYRLLPLDDTLPVTPPDALARWWTDHVRLRSVETGRLEASDRTFPGGSVSDARGRVRVTMRSLWPPTPRASLCGRLVLRWCLGRRRRAAE